LINFHETVDSLHHVTFLKEWILESPSENNYQEKETKQCNFIKVWESKENTTSLSTSNFFDFNLVCFIRSRLIVDQKKWFYLLHGVVDDDFYF